MNEVGSLFLYRLMVQELQLALCVMVLLIILPLIRVVEEEYAFMNYSPKIGYSWV